jgi:signal transduction histidine kinase
MANMLQIHKNKALLDRLRDEVEAVIVSDQEEGLKISQSYHNAAEEAGDAMHQTIALKYIAFCFFHLREFEKAIEKCKAALEVVGEHFELKNSLLMTIGTCHRNLGHEELALDSYFDVIESDFLDNSLAAATYNNIAVIYDNRKDYDKALKFYSKALDSGKGIQAVTSELSIKANRFRCLAYINSEHEAREGLKQLAKEAKVQGISMPRIRHYLGLVEYRLNNFRSAIEHFETSLSEQERTGAKLTSLRLRFHLSEAYEKIGNISQAEMHIKHCLATSSKFQPIHRELILKRALDFYQNQGKSVIALDHAKSLLEIVGAREIDKRERRISELQMQFESKEKDREIETLQRERDHQEALLAQARLTEEANVKLEKANEELRQFTYAVSHDLKEPIRQVKNYAHIALAPIKDKLSPKEATMVQFVLEGSHRAHQMIDDLYSFATVGEGEQQKEDVDLLALAQDSLIDLADKIKESGAVINLEHLPTVFGHKSMLRQLFLNLISNALKFAHPDRRLRINIASDSEGAVVIEDNGQGIPVEAQNKVFSLFQQVDRQKEGSGIGLALCAKIMQKHNGRIAVTSDGHSGTSFELSFSDYLG